MTAADFVLLRVRTLEAERDALAESHTALIKALEAMGDVHAVDGKWHEFGCGPRTAPCTTTCVNSQAALTKARKLEAEA